MRPVKGQEQVPSPQRIESSSAANDTTEVDKVHWEGRNVKPTMIENFIKTCRDIFNYAGKYLGLHFLARKIRKSRNEVTVRPPQNTKLQEQQQLAQKEIREFQDFRSRMGVPPSPTQKYTGAMVTFGDPEGEMFADRDHSEQKPAVINLSELIHFTDQGEMCPNDATAYLPEIINSSRMCLLALPIADTRARDSTLKSLSALLRHLPQTEEGVPDVNRFRIIFTGTPHGIPVPKKVRNNLLVEPFYKERVTEWVHHITGIIKENFSVNVPAENFFMADEAFKPYVPSGVQVGLRGWP